MESPLSLVRMHRDHEPQARGAAKVLPTSRRQSLSQFPLPARCRQHPGVHGKPARPGAVHWDHEPDRTNSCNNCYNNLLYSTAVHGSLVGRPTVNGDDEPNPCYSCNNNLSAKRRFMERPLCFLPMYRDHEPVGRVTPCAPQFGNAQTARRGLTRPTFRFVESFHGVAEIPCVQEEPDCHRLLI